MATDFKDMQTVNWKLVTRIVLSLTSVTDLKPIQAMLFLPFKGPN